MSYFDKARWISQYRQIREVLGCGPASVLEIGTGPGVLGAVVKLQGVRYQSMDIDPALGPDIVGSVTDIPLGDGQFDVVCCFQVLEHLPYECLERSLSEMLRVAKNRVVVSLPDARPARAVSLFRPRKGPKAVVLDSPFWRATEHAFDGQHYWEINKRGYRLRDIRNGMEKLALARGFTSVKTYRVPENTYHRFFVIR